ncbi:L-2-amino-thiazoline-4-carboxylic acid hydrolase [bacterium]|nr:L-2-amino-thiazoline-4-carboxylic acid hydrolase [bacterium]
MKQCFSDAQIADFLRRSYLAVDGLWFLNVEERFSSDDAMDLDESVWSVMYKIQARKAKEILDLAGGDLDDLAKAFQLKLTSEGYDFNVEMGDNELVFTITKCPWYEVLKSSGRTHLSESIADRICGNEFSGWTSELAKGVTFEMCSGMCKNFDTGSVCRLVFRLQMM